MAIQPPGSTNTTSVTTYGQLNTLLTTDATAQAAVQAFDTHLKGLQAVMSGAGATVTPMPGMYFPSSGPGTGGIHQRSFPRNIANSQMGGGVLVVSEPPQETRGSSNITSMFLDEWTSILTGLGLTAQTENMIGAWGRGGEVHCSSNAVREAIKQ